MQDYADEEGSRAAAGDFDAFRLRVFRPRPDGPEHGEQADGDGGKKMIFWNIESSSVIFAGAGGGGEAVQEANGSKDGKDVGFAAFGEPFSPFFSNLFPLIFSS